MNCWTGPRTEPAVISGQTDSSQPLSAGSWGKFVMGPGAPLAPGPIPALALTRAGALLRPGAPLSPGLSPPGESSNSRRELFEARRPAVAGPHPPGSGDPAGNSHEARRPALAGPRRQDAQPAGVVHTPAPGFRILFRPGPARIARSGRGPRRRRRRAGRGRGR